jgi:DNA-directed RNA polymerase specialized sigma24 family protein
MTDHDAREALDLLTRLARASGRAADADDLAADAALELLSGPAPGDGDLASACARALRRVDARRRRRARREAEHREAVARSLEDRERCRRRLAEDRALAADAVREALSRLRGDDAEIVAARLRGERQADVAARLGVSRKAVCARTRRIFDEVSESVRLGVV